MCAPFSSVLAAVLIAATSPTHAARNDGIGLAEALIRHDVATSHTYLHDNARDFRFFISVEGADLPAAVISALKDTGLKILPGSAWKPPGHGTMQGPDMRMMIATPALQPNGTYTVTYGFWCGSLCGSGNTATLRLDANGWHVVATRTDMID